MAREMFVPLEHPPGHAQCDFGQAWAFIGGKRRRIYYFVMSLSHSDGIFVKAYPAETTEAAALSHHKTAGVTEALRGLSRQIGVSQKQARPLDADALAAIEVRRSIREVRWAAHSSQKRQLLTHFQFPQHLTLAPLDRSV